MANQEEYKYRERADMNMECFMFLKHTSELPKVNLLLIVSQSQDSQQDDDQWRGFVATLKKFIKNGHKQLSDKFSHAIKVSQKEIKEEMK